MRRLRAKSMMATLLLAAGIASSAYLGWPELSPVQATRWETTRRYGLRAVASMEILDQQQLGDLTVVTESVDNVPFPDGQHTAAIVRTFVSDGVRWRSVGGGAIGTIAALDGNEAVSCAWTWLRLPSRDGEQPLAGFYCTARDDRVAAIEIEPVEGNVQRVDVTAHRVAVFPYAWPSLAKWPAQLPREIRLYDRTGAALALPTSPTAAAVGPH